MKAQRALKPWATHGFLPTLFLACLMAGGSAAHAAPSTTSPPADQPRFESGPCPFSNVETAPYEVTCGTVAVTENRAHDDGRRVRLAVAIVHSQSTRPEPDPVVFLEGGPGQSSMALLAGRLRGSVRVQAILQARDYIYWDQRGVGQSEPPLCTELDAEWFRNLLLGFSVEEQRRRNLETFAACRRRLQQTQTNIAQFGTATSAADLEDIRRAVGVRKWNLDGSSYGTRLGLVAMRDAPSAIRSVVLDGVVPIDAESYSANAWRFARVVELLDARCSEDRSCHERYPNLSARIYRLIAALKQHPLMVRVAPGPGFPVDHIVVNDRVLADGLYQAFYDSRLIPLLPAVIEQIERGSDATLEAMAGSLLSGVGAIRQSLNFAVDCHDVMPLTSVAAIHAANVAYPQLADAFKDDESFPSYCAAWNPNVAAPEELLPTVSSIPTLLLVGDFDPITPPVYAQQARATLTANTVLELPSAGHRGKSALPCVAGVEVAFLSNPGGALDLRCADDFARVMFVTKFLLLPGLTRLLLGLQTHAHVGLIVTACLAVLLPTLCLFWITSEAVYRHLRPREFTALRTAPARSLIGFASLASLGAFASLVYEAKVAYDSNPNLLLLGLPGGQHGLTFVAGVAGLLSAVSLVACLRRFSAACYSSLNWLGSASSIAYLIALFAFVHR